MSITQPFEAFPETVDPDVHPEGECPWARFERAEHDSWAYQHNGTLVVRDLAIAKSILSDRRFEQGGRARRSQAPDVDPRFLERRRTSLLSREGPDHQRMRRIASKAAFTPRAADRHRPHMQAIMHELADQIPAGEVCDAIPTVTHDYPARVIASILGSSPDDADFLSPIVATIFNAQAGHPPEAVEAALVAMAQLDEYLMNLIEHKRSSPGEDLLTDLIRAESEEGALTTKEVLDIAVAVVMAGTDTTRNQLAVGLHLFADHPEAWAAVTDDEHLNAAVEEIFRFGPISHVLRRLATEEVTIGDTVIPEGTLVMLHSGAANRDPSVHDNSNVFDIDRATSSNHLALGHGRKFCLGANLAKAEMVEAFRVLRERFSHLEHGGGVEWRHVGFPRGATTLPLRFAP